MMDLITRMSLKLSNQSWGTNNMYLIEYKHGPDVRSEYIKGVSALTALKSLMNLLRVRGMPVNLEVIKIKKVKE